MLGISSTRRRGRTAAPARGGRSARACRSTGSRHAFWSEIGLDLSTILIEEVVAWTGLGTGVVRRALRLTPRTSIELIERLDARGARRAEGPGWHATTIPAAALREGDFVTVITDDGRRGIAGALQVVRLAID